MFATTKDSPQRVDRHLETVIPTDVWDVRQICFQELRKLIEKKPIYIETGRIVDYLDVYRLSVHTVVISIIVLRLNAEMTFDRR